jgi:hypothetical protein
MMLRCAAVCVFSLLLAGPASAHDIAGVRIGATLSEASIAVKRANRAFAMTPLKDEAGEVAGLTAVIGPGPGPGPGDWQRSERAADEFVVMQNAQGKVWYVARYQRLEPGSRLGMDALLAALSAKFGAPARRNGILHLRTKTYVWDTDRAGNKVDPEDRDSPCDGTDFSRPPIAGVHIRQAIRFPAQCGVRIMLSDERVDDGLVSEFTLSAIDVKTASDALRLERRARDAELERERGNGKQPRI